MKHLKTAYLDRMILRQTGRQQALFALLVAGSLSGFAAEANAQQNRCAERESIVTRLESSYGETQQSIGLSQQNGMLEVYASKDTGTWTILVTNPNGVSCLVASGQAFETLAAVAPVVEDDA